MWKISTHTRGLKRRIRAYLRAGRYRENIYRATTHALAQRRRAVAEIPHWEALREQAHQIKREVIDNLEYHLERFLHHARQQGITAVVAQTAAAANAEVEAIARRHGVQTVVKSKSMVTEEIGLNPYLQQRGFDIVETDLGEFIIQLAEERPVHLVGPALHKSRQEIGHLFHQQLGTPYTDDPTLLARIARRALREKFLAADMGITGANFGIVDSGRVVVIENEGNARLCMTLPRIHVVIMGMERFIPSETDLPLFLTLLCRSATGQRLTAYVSVTGGPLPSPFPEGPEQVYYIIVDNGRTRLLRDPWLKQALYCIRCAACYNACPVYQTVGGYPYGWVYQGPIGAVITPEFLGPRMAGGLPFLSTLCGACTDVCPVKIPLHRLLVYQRHRMLQRGSGAWWEKKFFSFFEKLASHPHRWNKTLQILGTLQRHAGIPRWLPGWSPSRKLPRVHPQNFFQWWKRHQSSEPS